MNRRIKITKLQFKEALIELLGVYPIQNISIRMLCERADLNRSTFYAHYETIFQLFEAIQDDFIQHLVFFRGEPDKNALNQIIEQNKYILENKELFFALINNCNLTQKCIDASELSYHAELNEIIKLRIAYCNSGTITIIHKWLTDYPDISIEDISRLLLETAMKLI